MQLLGSVLDPAQLNGQPLTLVEHVLLVRQNYDPFINGLTILFLFHYMQHKFCLHHR